jgi:NAD(P)H-hydrate repair Nnr-like enzyme with NAD(P)H-hydrate dehydratase domain
VPVVISQYRYRLNAKAFDATVLFGEAKTRTVDQNKVVQVREHNPGERTGGQQQLA